MLLSGACEEGVDCCSLFCFCWRKHCRCCWNFRGLRKKTKKTKRELVEQQHWRIEEAKIKQHQAKDNTAEKQYTKGNNSQNKHTHTWRHFRMSWSTSKASAAAVDEKDWVLWRCRSRRRVVSEEHVDTWPSLRARAVFFPSSSSLSIFFFFFLLILCLHSKVCCQLVMLMRPKNGGQNRRRMLTPMPVHICRTKPTTTTGEVCVFTKERERCSAAARLSAWISRFWLSEPI